MARISAGNDPEFYSKYDGGLLKDFSKGVQPYNLHFKENTLAGGQQG